MIAHMHRACCCGLIFAASMLAQAQTKTAATPKFEVASVKPCSEGDLIRGGRKGGRGGGGTLDWSPGRLSVNCRPVDFLIRRAYIWYPTGKPFAIDPYTGLDIRPSGRILNQEIQGSPGWVSSARYTIDAKAEGPASREMMLGPMMQALLEDRFQLKIRHETKDVPVYVLTVAKGGPKLEPARKGSCAPFDFSQPPPEPGPNTPVPCGMFKNNRNGGIDTPGQTMRQLCYQFSVFVDRDVIDKTGISGAFDIHLDVDSDDLFPRREPTPPGASDSPVSAAPPDPLGAITSAVRKLGLQLEPGKEPAQFLVIDRIERPSGN